MVRPPSFREVTQLATKKTPSLRRWVGFGAPTLLVALAACAAKPPSTARSQPSASASAAKPPAKPYLVASESNAATEAATRILESGGSATDAAIAAALVSGVTTPSSSGIGGGGFALVYDASKKTVSVLDFRETAPTNIDPNDLEKKPAPRGALVGTPGEIAGLIELHSRWGRLPLKDDFAPAIDLAEKGFSLSPHMQRAIKNTQVITDCPALAPWLGVLPPGATGQPSGPINKALGATLRTVASKGKSGFYEGYVAAWMVEAVRAAGGALSADDLRNYRVVEREPLRTTWEGYDIYAMPPPSAGGLLLFELLGSFDKADLAQQDPKTAKGIHTLAESIRQVYADRFKHIGDPSFGGHSIEPLLKKDRLKARRASIKPDVSRTPQALIAEDKGTSHLIVMDSSGNIVTLTTTINGPFGSRVYAEGAGVLMNDEMDDFSRKIRSAEMGVNDPPGSARPGARPPSSMSPTIVIKDGKPVLSLGGSGGMRIATGVALVAASVLARGVSIDEAISQPRFHVSPSGELVFEPNVLDAALRRDLSAAGERFREEPNISAVQGISLLNTVPKAAADPRKFGAAVYAGATSH